MGAVRRGVCVHGVVGGGLCEERKWEQSSVVYACMVLSLVGCVMSGSGSSSQVRCMRAWCCRWAA